jgi:hypothetical protein
MTNRWKNDKEEQLMLNIEKIGAVPRVSAFPVNSYMHLRASIRSTETVNLTSC